ncbi:MAG: HD domain-containing protein [Candidatus Kerfeldbacteria bacterium]|nr:HD domain-containing protein [Candidatus Kerfeldbacteria bacterium]
MTVKLPTASDYDTLYQRYHTPGHIQEHMRVVGLVAEQLATARVRLGDEINLALLQAAAWLHDVVRLPEQWQYLPTTISTPAAHAEINYQILFPQWPAVAQVVRAHSLMRIMNDHCFNNQTEKILYYADKRVNHTTVVSLAERLQLGQQRWQVDPNHNQQAELLQRLTQLEDDLFTGLTIQPHDLAATHPA